jgi:hypothetical protein
VKVSGDLGGNAMHMAGQTVTVSKRNGGSEQVKLGQRIAVANGRDAWYTVQRNQRDRQPRPRPAGGGSQGCTDRQYAFLQRLLEEHDPGDDVMFNPVPAQHAIDKAHRLTAHRAPQGAPEARAGVRRPPGWRVRPDGRDRLLRRHLQVALTEEIT